jgi:antitoxin PrlF
MVMIHSRITSKAQTTIPRAVREALGVEIGDELAYEIDGERVVLRRYNPSDPFDNPFLHFTEWAGEADCKAYDGF